MVWEPRVQSVECLWRLRRAGNQVIGIASRKRANAVRNWGGAPYRPSR